MKTSPASLLVRKVFVACSIVLLIAFEAPAYSACIWKTSDIMDPRIDVGAQKSLMRQMSAGPPSSSQASAMIGAIKSGKLAGILLPPRQAVSQRAARMTPPRGYWTLLSGRNSICLLEPAGEKPMIIYKQKLPDGLIDIALRDAWAKCGTITPAQPCEYVADRWAVKKCSRDSEAEEQWFRIYATCLGCKELSGGKGYENCPDTKDELSCLDKLKEELKRCMQKNSTLIAPDVQRMCEIEMKWDERSQACTRRYRDQQKHNYCKNKANTAIKCEHDIAGK